MGNDFGAKIIQSGMLHKVPSEETEVQAEQRYPRVVKLEWPLVSCSQSRQLPGVHRHQQRCGFWEGINFICFIGMEPCFLRFQGSAV